MKKDQKPKGVIARRCEAPTKQSDTECRPESLTRDLLSIYYEILRFAQDNASHWIASSSAFGGLLAMTCHLLSIGAKSLCGGPL